MRRNLKNIKAIIFDMDGIIYKGNKVIEGAPETIRFIKKKKKVLFLTNNSTKDSKETSVFLKKMGFPIKEKEILTVSQVTASYLEDNFPKKSKVLVIGENALIKEVEKAGFKILKFNDHQQADIVIIGNNRRVNFAQINLAVNAIFNGAKFILTNIDLLVPDKECNILEAGAWGVLVEKVTSVKPIVIGKPEKIMFKYALNKLKTKAVHTSMVGDNLMTDIDGANKNGLLGILVLTGIEKKPSPKAKLNIKNINELVKYI